MELNRSVSVESVVSYFGDSLFEAFPNNYTLTKTKKVNLQGFRKEVFHSKATMPFELGEKKFKATLLQVYCWLSGVDITQSGVTRGKEINPLLEAIASYLESFYPQFKWESTEPKASRVSLDSLLSEEEEVSIG